LEINDIINLQYNTAIIMGYLAAEAHKIVKFCGANEKSIILL
jgi:hypothetical protein